MYVSKFLLQFAILERTVDKSLVVVAVASAGWLMARTLMLVSEVMTVVAVVVAVVEKVVVYHSTIYLSTHV